MNVCRVCGGPMVWTEFHNKTWCAVYGDHKHPEPGPLMLAADEEMQQLDRSIRSRFQRKVSRDDGTV